MVIELALKNLKLLLTTRAGVYVFGPSLAQQKEDPIQRYVYYALWNL